MGRYLIANGAMPTTAALIKQPTGTAVRTMLQLAVAAGDGIEVEEWGVSFDGTTAATPIQAELIDTGTVAATMSTAHVAANVSQLNRVADGGASNLSFGSTALTGYATAAVTEGTITTTRMGDIQQIPPSSLYARMFPLGKEFYVAGGRFLRVRLTATATVNAWVYVVFNS